MGTSSARRAPTSRWWRQAKGAATRYLSPAGGGAVDAREVVARYVAALAEGAGAWEHGALAAFRLTRRIAQNLGAWGVVAASRGWKAALADWGLQELAGQSPEIIAQGLSVALAGAGGGLEADVARTALVTVIVNLGDGGLPAAAPLPAIPEPSILVRQFLVTALHLRLVLDLGEPLEAAGGGYHRLRQGLAGIQEAIAQASMEAGVPLPSPAAPEHWQGLDGWSWVKHVMEGMMRHVRQKR